MVTIDDKTCAPVAPTVKTLNDVPVGQLFRGRVHFANQSCIGFYDGIFRKYRGAWGEQGISADCLVVCEQGKPTLTWGTFAPNAINIKGISFFIKCTQVENYEPLTGVLTVNKA